MAQSDCCLLSTFETSLDGFVALWTTVSVAQKALSLFLTTLGHEPVAWAQKINCIFLFPNTSSCIIAWLLQKKLAFKLTLLVWDFLLWFASTFYGFLVVVTQSISQALNYGTKDLLKVYTERLLVGSSAKCYWLQFYTLPPLCGFCFSKSVSCKESS